MDNIYLNITEMEQRIIEIDNNIFKLENIYNELNSKMKIINGPNELWDSDTQKKSYDKFLNLLDVYSNSINQMKSLKVFLKDTLNSYRNSENKLNDTINSNGDNLDVQ